MCTNSYTPTKIHYYVLCVPICTHPTKYTILYSVYQFVHTQQNTLLRTMCTNLYTPNKIHYYVVYQFVHTLEITLLRTMCTNLYTPYKIYYYVLCIPICTHPTKYTMTYYVYQFVHTLQNTLLRTCLLYTSDAADE